MKTFLRLGLIISCVIVVLGVFVVPTSVGAETKLGINGGKDFLKGVAGQTGISMKDDGLQVGEEGCGGGAHHGNGNKETDDGGGVENVGGHEARPAGAGHRQIELTDTDTGDSHNQGGDPRYIERPLA